MNMRGKWAKAPPKTTKINVTSAQGTANKNRRDFSPMTETGYKGYYNFEAFWQSGKVYEEIPIEKTKAYWKKVKEPKRHYSGSKGKRVLHAQWSLEDGLEQGEMKMDYITSRKLVYVPLYHEMIAMTEMAAFWKEKIEGGASVVVYDFDGPRLEDGEVTCLEVTAELLQEKLHDTRFSFGHRYVVAAHLAGLTIDLS
jgi:hypothetical protein